MSGTWPSINNVGVKVRSNRSKLSDIVSAVENLMSNSPNKQLANSAGNGLDFNLFPTVGDFKYESDHWDSTHKLNTSVRSGINFKDIDVTRYCNLEQFAETISPTSFYGEDVNEELSGLAKTLGGKPECSGETMELRTGASAASAPTMTKTDEGRWSGSVSAPPTTGSPGEVTQPTSGSPIKLDKSKGSAGDCGIFDVACKFIHGGLNPSNSANQAEIGYTAEQAGQVAWAQGGETPVGFPQPQPVAADFDAFCYTPLGRFGPGPVAPRGARCSVLLPQGTLLSGIVGPSPAPSSEGWPLSPSDNAAVPSNQIRVSDILQSPLLSTESKSELANFDPATVLDDLAVTVARANILATPAQNSLNKGHHRRSDVCRNTWI
jgi:hypothetical protein